jgi:hypothetical protein
MYVTLGILPPARHRASRRLRLASVGRRLKPLSGERWARGRKRVPPISKNTSSPISTAPARVTIQKGRLTRGRRFVPDSALEGDGFEPLVPGHMRQAMATSPQEPIRPHPGASVWQTSRRRLQTRGSLVAADDRVSLNLRKCGVLAMDGEKHEQIARRAYALWQAEGQPDGRQEEHWYCAAREIAAADSKSSAVKRPTRWKKHKT